LANEQNSSTSAKNGDFNRMYFLLLAALVALVLGAFVFFAITRQAHGKVSGAGTQKGMLARSFSTTA
jgi:hypothetical protein